jgi:predicted adenine nucleotide alpha hydrolase (AANH) superfamily ATPase
MKLLLHLCCAPCGVYPLEKIQEEGIYFEGFFYNPNIHPYEEFLKRKHNVEKLAEAKNFIVHYNDHFLQDKWLQYNKSDLNRCFMCYDIRLDEVATFASENGFDAFTSSLLVSPYQNHDYICEMARRASEKYKVNFYYDDFRTGFRTGQQGAKEMGLYRQKYCGCIHSFALEIL